VTVDTNRVPQPRHDDDPVEAHYACLERLCACLGGWLFITFEDEHGEEGAASYRCRRCNAGNRAYHAPEYGAEISWLMALGVEETDEDE